ncbi:response regulator [Cohnella thailandensis]|uniref:Response regulator n=1 Tax=Cohnella thailandensis TaxID=557557 RepID=A0A841SU06_9BACL|nr:response regulator [Cohnella thailandensis]MBB6635803.1 response regulator [Cohnella thailandensis]MBP1976181.1 two-component SAPR family response regulator [Cohnella thailandensis]
MLRAMIVEDELPTLELMERLIGRHPAFEVAGAFANPLEALDRFGELKPDVAFLDVEMPKMGGLALADKLMELDDGLQVVFTTAYPGYAVDAFRVNAADYLVKPVLLEDLERVVPRVVRNRSLHAALRQPAEAGEPPVRCLGTFETRTAEGSLVNWPTRKTEELFGYLLAHPNRLTGKWQLADLLWPDVEESRSLHNLHNTIYRLKKTLKDAGLKAELTHTNEGYLFAMPPSDSDLGRLRVCLSGVSKLDGTNVSEAEERFRSVKGALFGGKDYAWCAGASAEVSSLYRTLARMLTDWHRERGDAASAKELLRAYLEQAPLDEEMHKELLRLYAEDGETGLFRRQYESYERILEDELGIEPPEEIRQLAQRMKRERERDGE